MLTSSELTVAAVTAELAALDTEYQQRLDALEAAYRTGRRQLRDEIGSRRRTCTRLLEVLQAEAGKPEAKPAE